MEPKVVFADFFNTVVLRSASPNDVIYGFARMLGEKYSTEPSTIYKVFWKCKNRLAVERFWKLGDSEYTFEEVIFNVAQELKKNIDLNVTTFIQDALQCYIEAEALCLSLKPQTIKLLKNFKSKGAKIVLLSDFYCKSAVLETWLKRLGVQNLFDQIIVSCEQGCSKRSGKLYDAALAMLRIFPKEALMVGDSYRADCAKASARGIRYIHLKQKQPRKSRDLRQKIKYGANFKQLEHIFKQCPEYNFSNYAFPLYLFEKRLCQRLEEQQIKNVFFFSREGQFLKKLFEIYCAMTGKGEGIKTHYFCISRNSALPASLRPLGEETFDKVFPGVLCVTLRKFLTTLGFSDAETETISKQIGAKPDKIYSDMPHSAMFVRLCANKIFSEKYDQMRLTQAQNFRAYWDSFGVDVFNEKIAVVDVGWSGTMQTLVERHFGEDAKIVGYYVGARDNSERDRATKFGLLYSRKKKTYKRAHLFRHNMTYYEQILRANHGRTDSYEIIDGKPQPIFDETLDDASVYKRDIEPMQRRIASKFKQICQLDYDNCSTIEDVVARAFYRMSLAPTNKDMEWIMRCEDSHYDGFMRIGFTFAPYKHGMRRIVRGCEKAVFAARYFGVQKVRVTMPAEPTEDASRAAEAEESFI